MNDTERYPFETGTCREIGGNEIILLTGRAGAWLIESGKVDVFAVRFADGAPASRRRFVARFEKGDVIFASPASESDYVLVAVAVGVCGVRDVAEKLLYGLSMKTDHIESCRSAVEQWVDSVAAGVFDVMSPKEHVEPVPGEVCLVEEGACIRHQYEIVWAIHEEGAADLMANDDLHVAAGGSEAVPIGPHLWLASTVAGQVRFFSTLDRIIEGAIWDDLSAYHRIIIRAVASAEADEHESHQGRLAQKRQADDRAMSNAVSHLATVMSPEPDGPVSSEDPLLSACQIVGRAASIDVRLPIERGENQPRGRLERIAAASRFRMRRVALRDQWWCYDGGPLLGMIVDGDGQNRSPVALLPRKSSGYELVDPQAGHPERVDERVAESLNPFAYSFYRPFADRALSALDILKFAAEGCGRDFRMILLMGAAAGLLGLVTPILTGIIFNTVIPGAERIQLIHMVGALLACTVATALFELVRGLAVLRVESKMDATVQSAVWDRLLNLPTSFFRRFAAGDLAVRAGGISEIRRLLSGATMASLLSGLFSIFNLALLFYYDAGLAVWALVLTSVALSALVAAGYLQLRYQRDIASAQARLSGQVLQYITGITKLRVAGAETKSYERWAAAFADQRRLQFSARRIGNVLTTFNAAFPVLSMMVIFGVMIGHENAVMSTGDFIAFNGAYGAFTSNMMSATGAIVAMMTAIPVYEQAEPILKSLPEVTQSMSDPGRLSGELEVSQVSFRYESEGAPILDDVSISAQSGEFIALVGSSGSGKSTILRLLLGFEEAESGSIYYDRQDLAGLDILAVRRQIGVVLQNGGLMSGDIFTNIAGSSLASMDDAWQAAQMAGLDEDIRAMPMGMHTVISEGGTTLSGGQRQRLLIARAIVNRPRILFFDEATSALDNRTQAIVSKSLERLQATRIVVAHRLSTIINADRIYVLERGRIVQSGTYATLLEDGGLFADLVRRQMA